MSFFQELKRRNVFRVGAAYLLAAWVLLQIADFVLEVITAPDWVLQVLVLVAAIGLPAVLVFSWVFEMTPEGIRLESEIDRSQSTTPDTGRKLDRVIISFLAAAVIILLADRFMGTGNQTPLPHDARVAGSSNTVSPGPDPIARNSLASQPSIAVLPFVNMSSDPEQEYFSDGIAEEILNVLTRIPNLKVAARTSSFKFKGQQLDVEDIGRQLQVNHLLEGSVRKSGTTLRITAQLIETETGFHLWSKTFDRKLEDVFAVQDEIAAAIATELEASLSGLSDSPSATVDMAAYELYLKGRGLLAERKESSILQAIDLLQTAHAIDPTYAPAMAVLATAYAVLPWFSFEMPTAQAREAARDWATKSLAEQPDNVEALSVLGMITYDLDRDWAGARKLFEKALEINPGNVTANNFYGDFFVRIADFDSALVYESKAAELDPLSPVMLSDLAQLEQLRGENDRAIELANRLREMDPYFTNALILLGDIYYSTGNYPALKALWDEVRVARGEDDPLLGSVRLEYTLAFEGRDAVRELLSSRQKALESGRETASFLGMDMSLYGDFDAAGDYLLRAYAENDNTWLFPLYVRLPEQAPDSASWQEFWSMPGVAELARLRRSYGFTADMPFTGDRMNP